MPAVTFYHPDVTPNPDLTVHTGANQITWGYGLNTQTTPTYGGEVVQILSAYIDDLEISGDVGTYGKAEEIYTWFLKYMQIASQGGTGAGKFIETPIRFQYPERGWTLDIRVTELPGFRQATEIVAPSWQIKAAVVEGDPSMERLTRDTVVNGFNFNRLHGGIGYDDDNPFTNAFADPKYDPQEYAGEITDFYQQLLPSYLRGDFDGQFKGSWLTNPDTKKNKGDQHQDQDATSLNAIFGAPDG